jgi:transcriptional regulator with XRE-family HTH domain
LTKTVEFSYIKPMKVGPKIRTERQRSGMSIEELAKKASISAITLHRVETEKSSPSVFLLSRIAEILNRPVASFFDSGTSVKHLKRVRQRTVTGGGLKSKIIAPRGMIKDNIQVAYGEVGQLDPHTNRGIEYVYCVKGKTELIIDGKSYSMEPGDSIAFNANQEHSVKPLDLTTTFFAILVEDDKS